MTRKRTCVLWSGGKDCFLAHLLTGTDQRDTVFATFVPRQGYFRCHPLPILARQGLALAAAHEFIIVDIENWEDCYKRAFDALKHKYGIEQVISGDILSQVCDNYWFSGVPQFQVKWSWLSSMLDELGIRFEAPLSRFYAEDIINSLQARGIVAVITGLSRKWYVDGVLGRRVNLKLIQSLARNDPKFDFCGERGEYHTTVVQYGRMTFCDVKTSCLPIKLYKGIWVLDWCEQWLDHSVERLPA